MWFKVYSTGICSTFCFFFQDEQTLVLKSQTFATVFYVACNSSTKYTAFTHIKFAWLYCDTLAENLTARCICAHSVLSGYGYIEAITYTTQQSGQTPDKEVEIKNITVYISGCTETDTTGMLSLPTIWRFTVAVDINSNVFDFYFLIWSLSRLLCCVSSGFSTAAVLGTLFHCACTTERSPLNGPRRYIAWTVTLSPPFHGSAVILFSPIYFTPFHSCHLVILFTRTLVLITTWKPSLLACCLGRLPGTSGSW
jgi:hypothetical protein